jgi:KaiC/GvpD/RAD55 family RecA-like ATPase
MRRMKIKRWNIFLVSFMLLMVGVKGAVASPYQYISEIPLFLHFFLLLNIFLLAVAIVMIQEVKKVSASNVWNNILMGNVFTMVDAFALGVILQKYADILNINTSVLIALLYTYAVFMVNIGEYFLIKPLLKEKINLMRIRYILLYAFLLPAICFTFTKVISLTDLPSFQKVILIFLFILLFIFVIFSFLYNFLSLSKSYAPIGFVSKPFLWSSTGAFSLFIGSVLLFYKLNLNLSYYYILSYFIPVTLALSYYLRFAIEYPSLLQPKWKALMPFDLPKATAATTFAFLATSLYFTAKEYPNFIIYQNIPYIFVVTFLFPVFFGTMFIFTYLNTISAKTKLRYWGYLKYGLYLHIAVTLYVFSLIFLLWNDATSSTKLLFAVFGLVAFVFYLSFALDLRTILKDQDIKPLFDGLDVPLYLVFFCSIFFLIFFGISFTYEKASGLIGIEFITYPALFFFVVFFLIAFGAYLSITHKGFEEIMKKNIWSELSYIFAFIVFLLVYLIYSSLSARLQRFPYHDFVFIGYFAVLIIEIASTSTLAREFKYTKARKEDIVHLLNLHAHNFLRTDYLEGLWNNALDRYVTEDEVKKIRFDPSRRRFDLEETDEKTRLKIAVGILLGMQKLPNVEKITILRKSVEELKEDIAAILKEKILLLPDDLRSEFDESSYYPILYERVINGIFTPLETFIPIIEQANIFDRLKRRDERFNCVSFEMDEIRIKEEARFSRAGFLELFRLYLDAVEEKFPFKRVLLYELVREEIKKKLEQYDITVGEVLNMVPTGLEEMDRIMGGGLVKGSTTLLLAEETKMKQKMLLAFIKQGLVEGNSAMYATSKRPFEHIIGELRMDVEALKNIVIIDLYENLYTAGQVSELVEEEHRIIIPLSKILFQRSVVKTIKSQPRDMSKIVVIDVYDDFSRYYNTKEIFELLQKQIEGLKRWNCTSAIVIDPHSHLITREGIEEVKKNFENVLILSGEEKDASVLIEKLYHGTPTKNIIRLHL